MESKSTNASRKAWSSKLPGGWLLLPFALTFAACQHSEQENIPVSLPEVKADLATLANARVFFGHQSVGFDILDGVRRLAQEAGQPVRIEEIQGETPDSLPGLFHAKVGRNEAPESKCEGFTQVIDKAGANGYAVALLKFCYVDLGSRSLVQSPQQLFELYRKNVDALKASHPNLKLIHVTIPLESDPPGIKTWVKRKIGRSTEKDEVNQKRMAFNGLLRAQFGGPNLFDIAKLESTHADGTQSAFQSAEGPVETLAQEYTHDGGHLNEAGQKHVALAFIQVIAAALR